MGLAIANACYFNIGARLARYTDNSTYADLANRTWNLITDLGYISDKWDVYDGAHLPDCTNINKAQFSYNAAMLLQGAAFLYNFVRFLSSFKRHYPIQMSRGDSKIFIYKIIAKSVSGANRLLDRWLADVERSC